MIAAWSDEDFQELWSLPETVQLLVVMKECTCAFKRAQWLRQGTDSKKRVCPHFLGAKNREELRI